MINKSIAVYEPDNVLKDGYAAIFSEIFHDLKKNRWLTYQLFKRDFLAAYKQSFIGIFWVVIIPFVSTATFVILNGSGIFNSGKILVPYPLYAVSGMAFWQLFSTGLIAGTNSLVKAGPMIVKINFSKKSLVIASIGQSVVSFFVQLLLAASLCIYYGVYPSVLSVFVPLLIIPLILFTLGISFFLSFLNGILRDIGNIISMLMAFLMLLTPVLYAKPEAGLLGVVTKYNPLYYYVCVPREILFTGTVSDWKGFSYSSVVSVVIFLTSLLIFHMAEARVAERV